MRARYIDIHLLRSVPAANPNRGEYGEPKTLSIGNTVRGAISSQSIKRADRMEMEEELAEPAVRTRMIPPRVTAALKQAGWPDDLAAFAGEQIARSAIKGGLKTDPAAGHRTQAMIYTAETGLLDDLTALCTRQRAQLEEALAASRADASPSGQTKRTSRTKNGDDGPPAALPTKDISAILARRTACISLFGRMLAGHDASNVTGAAQVAWAFTTHTSDLQPDFFTAVEEWQPPGDSGSAHLNTAFLTAGVFYCYANVNLTGLTRNLDGDTKQALDLLALFMETFTTTLPQGKANSTAPHTLPDTIHYTVRDRRPVSYASAFDQPVRATHSGGYLVPSRQALTAEAAYANRLIGTRRLVGHGHTTAHPTPLDHLGPHHDSLDDLIAAAVHDAQLPAAS
ncbi:type I-E CRISPR-associated protein Cas7/Cse4/CasC [Streptomyces sp. SKN60]|uniref:type I-E CRISPR-associated protein Cas7/Cse4/CasC n=1 Tax=Streptomyces sp. SKN60 TaxID=2855506 RepID=UPI0022466AED|nr:type I-E CRISPR-associated protein Cas7/Cse4/CasC [Streptomyces sp. SKN60]MCX2182667.1 type I-E CRISPR-associated protein Cas7/Cse4/CasC [Streptomyces sp. SKN60]